VSEPIVCSIGTTDPWNAAGLGLDLRILAECGVRAVCVVAGITAQDAKGLHQAEALSAGLVEAQFAALSTAPIAAYRVGAIHDAATLAAIVARLRGVRAPIVYDPVAGPSGGGSFVDAPLLARIVRDLIPLVTLLTPNLQEAYLLTGTAPHDLAGMIAAGEALRALGSRAALVKGGHLRDRAADVLVEADGVVVFDDERIPGTMRGTGCVLAAVSAAGLAHGRSLRDAVSAARDAVRDKLQRSVPAGGMLLAP
jgi:hydroxymethylpyrimidine/phosphomethylpyrimidine kinase